MARTSAAPALPSSASIPSLPVALPPPSGRIRSNSNISGRLSSSGRLSPAALDLLQTPHPNRDPNRDRGALEPVPAMPTPPERYTGRERERKGSHPAPPERPPERNTSLPALLVPAPSVAVQPPSSSQPSAAAPPSLSPSQAAPQPTTPHTPANPPHVAYDRSAVVTPPPRPPRGPLRSPGAPRSPSMPSITTELSLSSKSKSVQLCRRALEHSKDNGDTLDISRDRKLDRIDGEMVDFFRTQTGREKRGVWRLALSYNALRDGSLVASFSKLNRLRYLNLKGNDLTAVPSPLLELASLEILDLSKNQITALPERPGRLAHLKVLSLSHNKISILPTYLAEFRYLKVFKVDHNPIASPPRDVLGPLIEVDVGQSVSESGEKESKSSAAQRNEEDLKPWIEGLRRYLRDEIAREAEAEAAAAAAEQATVEDATVKGVSDEDPTVAAPLLTGYDMPMVSAEPASYVPPPPSDSGSSQVTMKPWAPPTEEGRATPHLSSPETGIGQRNGGGTGSSDSLIPTASSSLSLPSHPFRHDRSTSFSSVTPPVSASTSSSASAQQAKFPHAPPAIPNGHTRGASYTATQRHSGTLTAKKSLPDLRQSHAKIIEERRGEAKDELRPLGLGIGQQRWQSKLQRPFEETKPPPRPLKMTTDAMPSRAPPLPNMVDRRDSQDGPTVDESRNSYFRRLSTLPPSTISKQVSPAMLMFVDSIRGILFALTQTHTALRQYLNFAVPDHVATTFARYMQPAGEYVAHLINALDRFDSMSRRPTPPASAIRGVVESAKETIKVFAKLVAVLRMQTPAFRDADARYTRSLLLSIYGGMNEIAHAWRTMLPLLTEMRPVLHPESSPFRLAPPMSQSSSMTGRTPISPILEQGETTPARSTLAPTAMPPVGTSPRSKSRRHAGSFSAQDVEKGMLMGSPVSQRHEWPGPDMGRIFEGAEGEGTDVPPFPLHAEPEPPADTPPSARAAGHAPTLSGSSFQSARNMSFDVRPPTPASATLFDDDLLDQIELATEVAFNVWLKVASEIGTADAPYTHSKADSAGSVNSQRLLSASDGRRPPSIPARQYSELVAALGSAEQVTASLKETLAGLRANPFAPTPWPLHDHAQGFIKTVVRVMEQLRAVMVRYAFSTSTRQLLSRLAQLARECAILIQVSSHRPTNSHPTSHASSHAGSQAGSIGGIGGLNGPVILSPSVSRCIAGMDLSSSEDPAPAGLRGLHLPARHGLRNGSVGRRD
ncbi:hypothetical protein CcaverHIS002_0101040 [Cutaneotrichosporon cavernicola]|uniref:RAM signaling network component n=1 Tax=Cutaneotrichosporon cavernicola TaxID=279322 RepID=A0AA48HXK6_9TREE|nr:uncharacterized protein CcaverHIS019_0101020 [Cutaneotrichosporon cavernicola]BEI79575.1 hypothetical protein CcaverHIS002_0101040 [Cutaneotrichosporon cavernicola]BEI87384.1 hypothetical protein CcaverHIS019_0101020 [Cutaneotrichosporon cavernicola]BEI95153.1 hypothetical protein CcaverHIS631_0101020 [Cutaneotrichosporon cavernicola]BEJ02927.1 hypothetical protein CcaverHIS641_0101020 [Cutaneotrichosporon cavernicola]